MCLSSLWPLSLRPPIPSYPPPRVSRSLQLFVHEPGVLMRLQDGMSRNAVRSSYMLLAPSTPYGVFVSAPSTPWRKVLHLP